MIVDQKLNGEFGEEEVGSGGRVAGERRGGWRFKGEREAAFDKPLSYHYSLMGLRASRNFLREEGNVRIRMLVTGLTAIGLTAGLFWELNKEGLLGRPTPPNIFWVFLASANVVLALVLVGERQGLDLGDTLLLAMVSSVTWTLLLGLPGPLSLHIWAQGYQAVVSLVVGLAICQMLARMIVRLGEYSRR